MAKARTKQGLSAKTYSGLNKGRMKKRGNANAGLRVRFDEEHPTHAVMFLTDPSGMLEFDQHQFREDGKWNFVPCAGDGCPLCADEAASKSKINYRFLANVWNLREKKVQILEGPKDMSSKIQFKFDALKEKGKQANFLKQVWDITRYPTDPVSYGVDKGDDDPVPTKNVELIDLQKYVDGEIKRYWGDELPTKSALDDDGSEPGKDAEPDDATEWTRDDLEAKKVKELASIAKQEGLSRAEIDEAMEGDDKKAQKAALVTLIIDAQEEAAAAAKKAKKDKKKAKKSKAA